MNSHIAILAGLSVGMVDAALSDSRIVPPHVKEKVRKVEQFLRQNPVQPIELPDYKPCRDISYREWSKKAGVCRTSIVKYMAGDPIASDSAERIRQAGIELGFLSEGDS